MTWLDLDSLGQHNQPLYKSPISEAKLLTVKIIESIHQNIESIQLVNRFNPILNRFNTTDIIESIQPSWTDSPEPTVMNRFNLFESIQSCKYPISSSNAGQHICATYPSQKAINNPPLLSRAVIESSHSLTHTLTLSPSLA